MKNYKKNPLFLAVKIIILVLTAVYPLAMVCTAGAGLIYNGKSYGTTLVTCGVLFIVSGIFMTAGALMCLPRKKLPNIISAVMSIAGLAVCLTVLFIVCSHADNAGWVNSRTLKPVSDMYKFRILPVIIPSLTAIITAIFQVRSF